MYKNVQTNPEKFENLGRHSCWSVLRLDKNLKARRGNKYRFVHKCDTFPTRTMRLLVRSSRLWEAYTQTCPKCYNVFYHSMLMPFQDCMPSFMNFRWVLDLLEFKTMYLNVCGQATVPRCLKFIPISCMGPKHATKDTHLIFQPIFLRWSMYL